MKKGLWLIGFVMLAAFSMNAQDNAVLFSATGGFYDDVFALEMSSTRQRGYVRYTVNGDRPTAQSPLYTDSLVLDMSLFSKSDIYSIVNCPEQDFFLSDSVRHCIVIRAAVFDENDSCISEVSTQSYFIRALGCNTQGLPVVSLCADSLDLFDYERGIFIPGIHFDSLNPYFTGNYYMKGREWERLCNFEFYELDNRGVNQQIGLRTHGNKSRRQQQKGLKVYAREEYGKKRIDYKFFDSTQISSFKRLTLKPFASTWNGNGCVDYLCNSMVRQLDVECLESRPCVLFLNGEYWGIYYIHEKPDEHYLEDHLDVDKDNINIIKDWFEADCGSPDNFNDFYAWMEQADLSDEEQFAYAEAHIDLLNALDYYIFEIFSANLDWPSYNVRMWQEGDGPWRWIFYDGDGCLQQLDFDAFANATYDGEGGYPASQKSTLFFRRLLENPQFQDQFASRFNELVATVFSYESNQLYFNRIKLNIQGGVPYQIERFGFPTSFESWEGYSMRVVEQFLMERPSQVIEALNDFVSVEPLEIAGFQCYPNPFSNQIRIRVETEKLSADEINIYDLTGRKVFSMPCLYTKGTNEITLNIGHLVSGVYLLKAGRLTHRIVKL